MFCIYEVLKIVIVWLWLVELREMKSYLSVSSIFCTMSMYYFYNQRKKWSIVRLKEGLCRLKGRKDIL